MQEVDLNLFYQFGKEMRTLALKEEKPFKALGRLINKGRWLDKFLDNTTNVPFPRSRNAVEVLRAHVAELTHMQAGVAWGENVDTDQIEIAEAKIKRLLADFEKAFEHECSQNLNVFAVTPKGDKSTRILIEEAEKKFPPDCLAVMSPIAIEDIREAGKCLAFERSTACAFHVCRATEGLMRAYYKHLTGNDWPPPNIRSPNWKVLTDQLRVKGAPRTVWARLEELREDRNSFAHPDVTVPPDEAPIVYEICTSAMFYMAKEMF